MLLSQINEDQQRFKSAERLVEQVEAEMMLELFGGIGALGAAAGRAVGGAAQAVGQKVQQGVANVKNTYNQGEIAALLKQYAAYRQELVSLLAKLNPPTERREPTMQFNSVEFEQEVLAELFGGIGALLGAAKDKAVQGAQAVGQKVQQGAQQVKSTYIKGEAAALLKKMAEIGRALKQRGYSLTPKQVSDFSRLRKQVGV